MKLAFLDFETNGIPGDPGFLPTEIGLCITKDLDRVLYSESTLLNDSLPEDMKIKQEIIELTGIDDTMLNEFPSQCQLDAFMGLFTRVEQCDLIVVWNGYFFDRWLFYIMAWRLGLTLPSVPFFDAKLDMSFQSSLGYTAADKGFLNHFAHAALGDVLATFEVLRRSDLDLEWALEQAQSKFIYCEAKVSYDAREKASSRGFKWNQYIDKAWVKPMRKNEIERQDFDFEYDLHDADKPLLDIKAGLNDG